MAKVGRTEKSIRTAWIQGYDAGVEGRPATKNPYRTGTYHFQRWNEGWQMAVEMRRKKNARRDA